MLNDITIVRSLYFLITEFAENPQLVRDGKLSAKALVTHTFPLTETRAAYDRSAAGGHPQGHGQPLRQGDR
jgi:threonine dehydrogenase-like Zn-dependent dehydrogenase